jgi:hexose oxidase
VKYRNLFTRRSAIANSVGSLLAMTGKPAGEAKAQFVAAAGGSAGTDLLILEPDSTQFFGLTQGFNRRWGAPNCAKILIPLTEAAAQEALNQAIAFGRGKFRVRGGGHCYEDFVFSDETHALIDMSLLNEVRQDSQSGVFYAQSGGTSWQLYRQLYWRYGVTLPAGSCYSVGLGGQICGGGYGLLSRRLGLTVDWLTGIHVVTVNRGSNTICNHVTRESPKGSAKNDLFWAHTGGGGGNFGLITRYEFATLPTAPQRAELFNVSWKWDDIRGQGGVSYLTRIIDCFEHLVSMRPSFFGLLKLHHEAAGAVSLVAQSVYDGQPTSLESSPFVRGLTATLRRFGLGECAVAPGYPIIGHPVNIPCPVPYQDLRWWESVQTNNGEGPNQKGKYKSAYMRGGFSAEQIATIYKYLTTVPHDADGKPIAISQMAQSLLQVDSYGGRINEVMPEATAVWQRSSIMKLQYQTYWQDNESGPSADDPHISWIRDFYREVYAAYGGIPDPERDPTHNVDGCYINYPDADLNEHGRETALRLYYGGNLPRLMQAKQEWDPGNFFQNRQSILPA